ncbi:shikimate dehydrogenase [Robbsia sp. Bb-Pol-6]|uniref:Shikimate dehydrogenase (NADP(+)) n=1 Tax=Robbsia betulipollinis TaxID=2981849 RepID=A0ABT3ZQQ8_9BURK|nr:shikimate dehydrogenase [Robbsia betulipollinis]MCY0388894.1 shikimate dehydrogenase [Robbsia betulipollinis]
MRAIGEGRDAEGEARAARGTAGGDARVESRFDPPVDRYAVIGNPVGHSKSPDIHAAFAAATGQRLRYDRLEAPLDGFAATVQAFAAAGGRGLNVTVPFKLEAFALADTLTARAAAAGAVNTLRFQTAEGRIVIEGDNTDGAGLVHDLQHNLHCRLAGARILLLGAGGAARGVLLPLLECRPACLAIANRTPARAHELQAHFAAAAGRLDCLLTAAGTSGPAAARYDVVINATSGSLAGDVPAFAAGAIGPGTLAYDMMYGAEATVFMRHAAALGATAHDGLGMLVEQAAESFALWRGVRPDGGAVLARLRAARDASLLPAAGSVAATSRSAP